MPAHAAGRQGGAAVHDGGGTCDDGGWPFLIPGDDAIVDHFVGDDGGAAASGSETFASGATTVASGPAFVTDLATPIPEAPTTVPVFALHVGGIESSSGTIDPDASTDGFLNGLNGQSSGAGAAITDLLANVDSFGAASDVLPSGSADSATSLNGSTPIVSLSVEDSTSTDELRDSNNTFKILLESGAASDSLASPTHSLSDGNLSGTSAAAWTATGNGSVDTSEFTIASQTLPSTSNPALPLAHSVPQSNGSILAFEGDLGDGLGHITTSGLGVEAGSTHILAGLQASGVSGLVININWDSSVANAPAAFKTAVEAVASYYESVFKNPITITIDVGYGEVAGQSLGSGALGESEAYLTSATYSQLEAALANNANAIGNPAAAASLSSTSSVSGNYWLTTAEAQALGLSGASGGVNGYVGFSNSYSFAYSNSGGVPSGQYDFFGVVAHEFSEIMGRQVMVGENFAGAAGYEPLDLFHYAASGIRDFSGTTAGYASPDGGVTSLDNFNTNSGGDYGDWAGSAGNDAYLAFSSSGVVNPVTASDLELMNLLGWYPISASSAPPTISSMAESPSSGDLNAGKVVTFTLTLSEVVYVSGGTPTLTLNDGGTATYLSGSGTSALTFSYTVGTGQNIPALAATVVNLNSASVTDGSGNAANLSLSGLTQNGPQIDTTAPTISAIAESPTSGDLNASKTVTFTLTLSEAVTVNTTGGIPTLTLNDGGIATFVSGSGTSTLTFSYTVGAGQNTSGLAATAVNLNAATLADGAGNAANLSLLGLTQNGPQIDTTAPAISAIAESPASGDLNVGKTVTFTLTLTETVTVNTAGGSPTLTLNDGATATYVGGSGTNTLTFSYTVGAGQTTSSLAANSVNLNAASLDDGAGNAANISLGGLTQTGPQIDTTRPTISSVAESPSSGDLDAGKTVTFTLTLTEAVNVSGGTPTLTLNDGGIASYVGGSGTNTLTFSYTVGAGQTTAGLAATSLNLNAATIADGASNTANVSLSGLTQNGPQVDTTAPTITAIAESPASGSFGTGETVTFTLALSEVVTVSTTGGSPTLTLNDGGIASYVGGSGTNTLTFSYTVGSAQNTSGLAATSLNLNSATIADGAGNAANLSLSGLTQTGPQIETTAPIITAIAESPASGNLNAGKTVTLTLTLSEAVTVNTTGGSPTLILNDGGSAAYVGGSGTNTLTFSYTVGAGQTTAGLAATALNLNAATITDGTGNAITNLSLSGLSQTGPQIDTTAPTVTTVTESPSSGALGVGKTVTFTLTLNESATVDTAGGTPTLTLNDGGTATYVSGSGTNTLTFSYTVQAGQNVASLAATTFSLNSAVITDAAGNAAINQSLSGMPQSGPLINTGTPSITAITESPANGDLGVGATVAFTLTMSEAVNVTGTPTLALNDGGTATYAHGSGTNTLTFNYTVLAGQNIASLAATMLSLNSATITDGAGNAVTTQSLSWLSQSGPMIQTGPQVDVQATQIEEIYQAVLQRAPTGAEGTAALALGSTFGSAGIVASLVDSSEAIANVYPILQMFDLAFGHFPGAATLASMVETGLTVSELITAIVASPTFANVYNGGVLIDPNVPVTAGIVQALYTQALGHAPSQATLNGWLTSGLSVAQAFQAMVTSQSYCATTQLAIEQYLTTAANNSAGLPNSTITASAADVTPIQINTIYEAVLQRAPTANEVTASLALDSTTGNAAMIAALVNAPEAVANVYPILQMFNLAFGYFPGAATLASMVETGLTLPQLAAAVVGSQTFANVYNGGTLLNANAPVTAGIVEALYSQALGHAPSQATLNGWLTSGLTVAQAFQDMVTSDSYFATTQLAIEQYLTAAAINQAALTAINGTDATGSLTLGALATPLTTSGLTVLGGSGTLTVVASGAGDTITELNTGTAGGTITANGAGDTINAANGANAITASGVGDHINLGVVSTGTSIIAPQTIHAAGAGDTITFTTTAADSTAVTWGTGASSTVDGGNSMIGIGANSTVNFGNNAGSGSETVVLTGDLAGATTSGGTSTAAIAMTTLGNVHHAGGDLIVFGNAVTELLAGTGAVNVSSATSLARALDLAAASAASFGGGTIAGHTGVIDWFQYGGNTYLVEAVNGTATAATHTALATTDELIKIVGTVNLTAETLSLHTLTL